MPKYFAGTSDLKELGSFFSSKSLYLSLQNNQIQALHLAKDVDSRTPLMLLAEMIRAKPETHYYRKPILEKLAMLETPILKSTFERFLAQDEKIYMLMTLPTPMVMGPEMETTIQLAGGLKDVVELKMDMLLEVFEVIKTLELPSLQQNTPSCQQPTVTQHGLFSRNLDPMQNLTLSLT